MDNQPDTKSAAAAPADLPAVPATWPGATGIYKYSKATVKFNLQTLILVFVVGLVAEIVVQILLKSFGLSKDASSGVSNLVGIVFSVGSTIVLLASLHRSKIEPMEAIKQGLPYYFKYLLMSILIAIALGLSLLLLIVPFFFVFPRLVLAPYFLIDKNLGITDAIKASWDQTKGHATKVWGIIGLTIAMALLCVTIIGIPVAIYLLVMYSAATVLLYAYILEHPATKAVEAAPAAPAAAPPAAE